MQAFRWSGLALRAGLFASALALLGSCSGAVSDPASNPPVTPTPITVTPGSATVYPGIPTSFGVTGGAGPSYVLTSDNQAVIQSLTPFANGFTLVVNPVAAETKFNLVVQDSTRTLNVPITIEPIAVAPLTATPSTLNFQGSTTDSCANNISADILVFGGVPPYVVSQPASFNVNPSVLTLNPGRVTVSPIACGTDQSVAILDSAGQSVTVKLNNAPGTGTPTTPQFALTPSTITLAGCGDVALIALSGGSGKYIASSGALAVSATVNGNIGQIRRVSGFNQAPPQVQVYFSDGALALPVTVNLSAQARGPC